MAKSIEECVYSELSGSVALTSAVSNRISPSSRPSSYTLPCVVYEVGVVSALSTLSGDASTITGEVSVTAFADTVTGTISPANAIRTALDNVTGTLDTTTYSFRFISADLDYEPPVDGDDFGVYSRSLSFTFFKDVEDL